MHGFLATLASKSTTIHALARRRTRRLRVNPYESSLGVETAHHVVTPDRVNLHNAGPDGNIPRLYQLAAMRMRFVLECTSGPVARSWSVIASGSCRLSLSLSISMPSSSRIQVFDDRSFLRQYIVEILCYRYSRRPVQYPVTNSSVTLHRGSKTTQPWRAPIECRHWS
jgi:hypothetical protein